MSETIIHPETGAILRRRKRMETVTYQGQSRTVEVEGWFPDDEGDGILVGADSKPLYAVLAEMKAGWPDPARPGVPPSEGWWWLLLPLHVQAIRYFDGETWRSGGMLADPKDFAKYTLIGPVLTPAEVDARVKEAKRDALEEAAKLVETHAYTVSNSEPQFRLTPSNHAKDDMHHTTIAAAIRALKGEGDE